MTKFSELGLSQTVYGYPHKDVENVVKNLWRNETEILLNNYREPWTKKQDGLHTPFLESWKLWSSNLVSGMDLFNYGYPVAGSSEGIREVIAAYKAAGGKDLCVFYGEYEGYSKLAEHYGLQVHKIDRNFVNSEMDIPKNSLFWLSQPSALDGNIWVGYDKFMNFMSTNREDVAMWIDLAYVGSVADVQPKINLNYSSIRGVAVSWSKPFGVYYHRVGAIYSKTPMVGLYETQWFKNLFSLRLGQQLCETFTPCELAIRSKEKQVEAIDSIFKNTGVKLIASDVSILATVDKSNAPAEWVEFFNRAPNLKSLRVCLSPYFK